MKYITKNEYVCTTTSWSGLYSIELKDGKIYNVIYWEKGRRRYFIEKDNERYYLDNDVRKAYKQERKEMGWGRR